MFTGLRVLRGPSSYHLCRVLVGDMLRELVEAMPALLSSYLMGFFLFRKGPDLLTMLGSGDGGFS